VDLKETKALNVAMKRNAAVTAKCRTKKKLRNRDENKVNFITQELNRTKDTHSKINNLKKQGLTTKVLIKVLLKTNGELISVRRHNYNCMLDYGIY